uniref:Putative secreted protein n=1 Tax=Amblyomma triste TaxID=251400 RepID=A0A023G328_AMBTT
MIKMSGEIVLLLLSVLWAADAENSRSHRRVEAKERVLKPTKDYLDLGKLDLSNAQLDLRSNQILLLTEGSISGFPRLHKVVKNGSIIWTGEQTSTDYDTQIHSVKVHYQAKLNDETSRNSLAVRFGRTNLTVIISTTQAGAKDVTVTLMLKKVRMRTQKDLKAKLIWKTKELKDLITTNAEKVIKQKMNSNILR